MDRLQEANVDRDLLIKHPFTMMVAGSTGSGKTRLVREILSNYDKITNLNRCPRVLWCYGISQQMHREPLPNITMRYHEGFPDEGELCDVIVIDDLQSTASKDPRLTNLFTRYSHHRNVSIIFIVQNLYLQSKEMRTISLNCHYLVLMHSRRDRNQIARLASQLYPGETDHFMSAYKNALSGEYGYLLLDLTPTTDENFRLRTNILPVEYPLTVYQRINV